jgi:hypothetical protein
MQSLRSGAACASALLFAVTAEANAATAVQWKIEDGGNGHWYSAVTLPQQIPWDTAKADAESMTHLGETGFLATLTSQTEDDFVWQHLGTTLLRNHWLGGFQADGSPEPAGGWQWITGEFGITQTGRMANRTTWLGELKTAWSSLATAVAAPTTAGGMTSPIADTAFRVDIS